MSNIFKIFKVNIKDARKVFGCSIVNFEHISHIVIVIIAEVKHINAIWGRETIVSYNKFVFSNCGIYNVLWARKN